MRGLQKRFVHHVLPLCGRHSDLSSSWVAPSNCKRFHHPQVRYAGFVEDLGAAMEKQPLMIAPLFSDAGLKIIGARIADSVDSRPRQTSGIQWTATARIKAMVYRQPRRVGSTSLTHGGEIGLRRAVVARLASQT